MAKSKENDHFWKAKNLGQSISVVQSSKIDRMILAEAQCRGIGHWRRDTSNRETDIIFLFRILQRLGNLADHVLTLLAI